MSLLLGWIADDFTCATDLASMLVRQGIRTVQLIGVPSAGPDAWIEPAAQGEDGVDIGDAQAVVVALKSRTIKAEQAVAQSLATLDWLRRQGARQILFKYCSTFDSTDAGNIGPVSEALLEALGSDFTIACPALPENGRTVYRGHLFVGDQLLSNSSMRHHPLTPMTDSDLVQVLGRQSRGRVGLLPFDVVDQGIEPIRERIEALRADGVRQVIADALTDRHLVAIGHAAEDLALITGGSGIAMGLPGNFRDSGLLGHPGNAARLPAVHGHAAVLAGSCSNATLGQIAHFRQHRPALRLDVRALASGKDEVGRALDWADERLAGAPILISASGGPDEVLRLQTEFGREEVGAAIERAMAAIAKGLVAKGVRRLVVAGGETSGAVVEALGVHGLRIGRPIDPGVPWTTSLDPEPLALALKSGNFGAKDFFIRAFAPEKAAAEA
jgi:uncharacterized protein YgbK (DUF1537 family)